MKLQRSIFLHTLQFHYSTIHIKKLIHNQPLSDHFWSNSEIYAVQQSVEWAQKEAIKWLINTSRGEKFGEYGVEWGGIHVSNGSRIFRICYPSSCDTIIIMALWLIAHHPTLILSWQAWPTQRNAWRTWKWSKFALQLIQTSWYELYKLAMQIMWSDPKRWSSLAMLDRYYH